jgi:hypothetical protein
MVIQGTDRGNSYVIGYSLDRRIGLLVLVVGELWMLWLTREHLPLPSHAFYGDFLWPVLALSLLALLFFSIDVLDALGTSVRFMADGRVSRGVRHWRFPAVPTVTTESRQTRRSTYYVTQLKSGAEWIGLPAGKDEGKAKALAADLSGWLATRPNSHLSNPRANPSISTAARKTWSAICAGGIFISVCFCIWVHLKSGDSYLDHKTPLGTLAHAAIAFTVAISAICMIVLGVRMYTCPVTPGIGNWVVNFVQMTLFTCIGIIVMGHFGQMLALTIEPTTPQTLHEQIIVGSGGKNCMSTVHIYEADQDFNFFYCSNRKVPDWRLYSHLLVHQSRNMFGVRVNSVEPDRARS